VLPEGCARNAAGFPQGHHLASLSYHSAVPVGDHGLSLCPNQESRWRWATLDPANTAQFLCDRSQHLLRYRASQIQQLEEYEKGVKGVLAGYNRAQFSVNDDATIHAHGDLVWATATVDHEMTTKAGKVETGNFRWTVVFENEDGQWLIVHEHVSAPLE
jgi:hypothetical protein